MKFVSSISNLANFLSESEEKCFSLEVGKKFQQLQDHILGWGFYGICLLICQENFF